MRKVILFLGGVGALATLLVSCDKKSSEEPPQPVKKSVIQAIPVSIPLTDLLGRFGGNVHDIAFWHHGSQPFKGGVIASNGPAGLVLVSMEGQASAPVTGNFTSDIAITYLMRHKDTEDDRHNSNALFSQQLSLIAAYDAGLEETTPTQTGFLRFFTIEEEENTFLELTLPGVDKFAQISPPAAYCFVSQKGQNTHNLLLIGTSGVAKQIHITLDKSDNLTVTEGLEFTLKEAKACASDLHNGTVYISTHGGDIYEVSGLGLNKDKPEIKKRASLPGPIVDIGIMLITSAKGDDKSALLAMTKTPGKATGYMLNSSTGEAASTFTLGEFEDISALTHAGRFAVGSGNLGGLYRRGAVAVIDPQDETALKLAPLSTITTTTTTTALAGEFVTPREALLRETKEPVGDPTSLLPDTIAIDPSDPRFE